MYTRGRPTAVRQSMRDTTDTREHLRIYTTCDRVKHSASRHKNEESWKGKWNDVDPLSPEPGKGAKSEAHWTQQQQQLAPSHWHALRSLIPNQRHLTAKVPQRVHTQLRALPRSLPHEAPPSRRTHRAVVSVFDTFVERLQPPLSPKQSAHPECPLPRAVH